MGKVFLIDEVYRSDSDYIIGGFQTDQISGFTINDIKTALSNKLSRLIDDYLEIATSVNAKRGVENPLEESHMNLAAVLMDNLEINTPYIDKETIITQIINCDKTQKWFMLIQDNINEATDFTVSMGIQNQSLNMDENSIKYQLAKEFSEESTLEQIIEQLSMIEL